MKKELFSVVLLMFSSLSLIAQFQIGADIDGESANDWSGRSVSMPDAYTIAIGAVQNSGNGYFAGHTRVLMWNGNAWIQKGLDIDGEPGDKSGVVSMPNSNTVAVGSPFNDANGSNTGRVRVYSWTGNTWIQKGLDILGEGVNDYSGTYICMPDENTVAIGAERNDGGGNDAGHVRVYVWNGNAWVQKGLDINGEAAGDRSGTVSMPNANTVAIGAVYNDGNGSNSGHVRIYSWNGSAWVQKGLDIDGEAAGDNSGVVSMPNENTVAIGAYNNNWSFNSTNNGWGRGHVRIFDWNGSTWTQRGLDIDGEAPFDWSGAAVDMPDANTVAIGAPRSADFAGQVRVFSWNGSAWVQYGIDIDGEAISDYSGVSISMPNPNMVAIGASGNDDNGFEAGHTRVYSLCEGIKQLDQEAACGSFTWVDGITYTSSIQGVSITQFDAAGCRYNRKLSLTILSEGEGTLEWARNVGNSGEGKAESVVSSDDGSVYTVGTFSGTVDFDPGSATYSLTAVGVNDLFIQKLDASGNFVWAKSIGGPGANVLTYTGRSIAIDNLGKVYVGGNFEKTVDFDPNAGVTQLSGTLMGIDAFILKLTANGNLEWVRQFGGNYVDQVNSICVDRENDVCATGTFSGTVDFDPGAGTSYLLSNSNNTSVFVMKLRDNGNFMWAKKIGGDKRVSAYSIITNPTKDVFITGSFLSTADFDPGTGVSNLTSSSVSETDAYLLKLDVNGNFQWVRQIRGGSYVTGNAVTADANGNVVVTGQFAQTVDFNFPGGTVSLLSAGSRDMFIAKYDAQGQGVWVRQVGGDGTDIPFAITTDLEGNLYTTGYFSQKVNFNLGNSSSILTAKGYDVFVLTMDPYGSYNAIYQLGGTGKDIGYGVDINSNGSLHVAGQFESTASFSSGWPSVLVSNGLTDAFVFKLNICDNTTTQGPISLRVPIASYFEVNEDFRDIILHPNPTFDGTFHIVSEESVVDVKVYDLTGRLMNVQFDEKKNAVIGTMLSVGEYIVHIKTVNSLHIRKVIKAN